LTHLSGNVTRLSGNVTGLRGYVTGLRGDVTGLTGDLDACALTAAERAAGINVHVLLKHDTVEGAP
jgi:hypothetical protein